PLQRADKWTDEFRGIGRDSKGANSVCSKGLCLRYFSIEERDLQRHDSWRLRRNTWHLRMDVGNRSEPEHHASNKNTAAGEHGDLVLEQQYAYEWRFCSNASS